MEELVVIKQLPIIEQQLHILRDSWEQRAFDAETMSCEDDSLQKIKKFRAETTKEFESLEARRKQVKVAIMEPYNQFEAVYKQCVTDAYKRADSACKQRISEIESDLKSRCESGLIDYFDELCAAHHLDWLTYERAGIKVDMASAKAKTPKKLREQLVAFVVSVAESVERISGLEDAGEIMVEYQQSLDAAGAICAVKDRHRRIEDQKKFQEQREAIRAQELEAVRRVEALAPPAPLPPPEPVLHCTFSVRATKSQLRKLKEYLEMEGIQYE